MRAIVWVVLVLLTAGCTMNGVGDTRAKTVKPEVLSVGSDLTYPPYAYLKNGDPAGFDVELTKTLGKRMGIRARIVDTRFEQLIPGVNAGQFDVIASDLYVTKERARVVRYVPYFTAGSSLVARDDGPQPARPDELCGRKVGIIKGAQAVPVLRNDVSERCRAKGKPAVDVRVYPTDPEATQSLRAGNVDVQLSDSAVAKHAVDASDGGLRISSHDLLYRVPVGLAVARDNEELADALTDALADLRRSGAYDEMLDRYNLEPSDPKLVASVLGKDTGASKGFDWAYLVSLFAHKDFWRASLTVVELSVVAWLLAATFGLLLAIGGRSRRRLLRWCSGGYVWFFRSLPLLVLIIIVYNAPQLAPGLRPILSNVFVAGVIALTLSESAYMAEIHRGGLLAVGRGQHEAALALGLRQRTVFTHVVLPQALRVAIPALNNQFVTIVKLTSLLSVISLAEILLVAQRLYTENFRVVETLLAAAVFYVAIVTVFDRLRAWIEKRVDVNRRSIASDVSSDPGEEGTTAPRRGRPRQPHSGERVVRLAGVRKRFGDVTVLDGVDLDVHRGEVVAIVGPSGSGKTTLIRTMNELEHTDDGEIEVNAGHVGMVFQGFHLFPHLTALGNVTLAPVHTGSATRKEATAAGRELLRKVGLERHAEKYPHQLSGGQQQRVAIARALAMRPSVILFDEPTSALDPELVGEVLMVIADLATEGTTMIVVTHEMRFARDIADWVVFMEHGRVVEEGPPEQVLEVSDNERTRKFLARTT